MSDETGNSQNSVGSYGGQMREALDRLCGLVVDGLKHGFFEYTISCDVGSKGKRQLMIRAGKSHKFTIPEDNLPR